MQKYVIILWLLYNFDIIYKEFKIVNTILNS